MSDNGMRQRLFVLSFMYDAVAPIYLIYNVIYRKSSKKPSFLGRYSSVFSKPF
jgi:hypothetical protein